MHIPDVLSPPVIAATVAAGGVALAASLSRARDTLREETVPIVGVLGAFVFAAQMVNFHFIPGVAVSTHLVGATLLTLLAGPALAILVLASVLTIQAVLYWDGTPLSLGANLLNMAVIPSLITELMARALLFGRPAPWRRRAVVCAAAYIGFVAGACACAAEVSLSLPVPDRRVLFFPIVGIHALLGVGEAIVTILCYEALGRMLPELQTRYAREEAHA